MMGVLNQKRALPDWLYAPFNTVTQFNDLSSNNTQLTKNGTGLVVNTTNDPNGALQFSTTGWLTTNTAKPLLAKNFKISCEIFIAPASNAFSAFLAQRINSTTNDIEFYSLSDGRLYVVIYFSDNSGETFTGVAVRNQWQSIEMSRIGNVFTLKVDGVIAETKTINKTVRNLSNGIFSIGSASQGSASGNPTGSMRKLRIQVGN